MANGHATDFLYGRVQNIFIPQVHLRRQHLRQHDELLVRGRGLSVHHGLEQPEQAVRNIAKLGNRQGWHAKLLLAARAAPDRRIVVIVRAVLAA